MAEVELRSLPDCDICKLFELKTINKAEADSATVLGRWGYTCSQHARWRVGSVTWLKAVELETEEGE